MLVSWDTEDECVATTHDRERNREFNQSEINGEGERYIPRVIICSFGEKEIPGNRLDGNRKRYVQLVFEESLNDELTGSKLQCVFGEDHQSTTTRPRGSKLFTAASEERGRLSSVFVWFEHL